MDSRLSQTFGILEHRLRRLSAVICILGSIGVSAAGRPCAAESYDAYSWNHGGSSYYQHNPTAAPPTQYGYPTTFTGNLSQNGHGVVTPGEEKLASYLYAYGAGNYGTCGYYDRAWDGLSQNHDDFVFSCADGRSTVTARMRLRIKGHASVGGTTVPDRFQAAAVLAIGMPGGGSQWVAHTQFPASGCWTASSGMFAAIDADALDGTFTGSPFTVSTNVPVSIGFTAELQPHANSFDGGAYIWSEMSFADSPAEGISFPLYPSPVFELPEGCTCSSATAKVADNTWCPNPVDCITPVQNVTWGTVKAMHR